ncbi:IS66 family transposase [Pedobacter sp.]|uniref:IS66 family transposase n=1 Tax=Pedobacter sp. TaxID=1411316 RepID=UPI0039C98193
MLLTFLYHYDVPADNNKSELAIRNIKVKQKASGMFKSAQGVHSYAIMRSVTDICIKNSQSIINAFAEIAKLKYSI